MKWWYSIKATHITSLYVLICRWGDNMEVKNEKYTNMHNRLLSCQNMTQVKPVTCHTYKIRPSIQTVWKCLQSCAQKGTIIYRSKPSLCFNPIHTITL